MIGKFLAKTVKIVTLPVDLANATSDLLTGGTGDKVSRMKDDVPNPLRGAEKLRDILINELEELD